MTSIFWRERQWLWLYLLPSFHKFPTILWYKIKGLLTISFEWILLFKNNYNEVQNVLAIILDIKLFWKQVIWSKIPRWINEAINKLWHNSYHQDIAQVRFSGWIYLIFWFQVSWHWVAGWIMRQLLIINWQWQLIIKKGHLLITWPRQAWYMWQSLMRMITRLISEWLQLAMIV